MHNLTARNGFCQFDNELSNDILLTLILLKCVDVQANGVKGYAAIKGFKLGLASTGFKYVL